jgi:putative transcriptional regulator
MTPASISIVTGPRRLDMAAIRTFTSMHVMKALKTLRMLLIVAASAFIAVQLWPARAAGLDSPKLIVASPKLQGPYARTVLISVPAGDDAHIGFILNRPTNVELAALLPGYARAKQATAPVFIGGPNLVNCLFAIVPSARAPAKHSIELSPGLFMSFREKDVVRIIERFPGEARFFVGVVAWDRGELEAQVAAGAWRVVEPNVELVLDGSVGTQWERLRPMDKE